MRQPKLSALGDLKALGKEETNSKSEFSTTWLGAGGVPKMHTETFNKDWQIIGSIIH